MSLATQFLLTIRETDSFFWRNTKGHTQESLEADRKEVDSTHLRHDMSERPATPTGELGRISPAVPSTRATSEGTSSGGGTSWRKKWEQIKTSTAQRRRSNDGGNSIFSSSDDEIEEFDLDKEQEQQPKQSSSMRRASSADNLSNTGASSRKLFNTMESAKHKIEAPVRRLFGKESSGTNNHSTSGHSLDTTGSLNDDSTGQPPSPKPIAERVVSKRRGSLVERIKPIFKRRGTNESGTSFDSEELDTGSTGQPRAGRRRTGDHTTSSGGDRRRSIRGMHRAKSTRRGTLDSGSNHSLGFGSRHSTTLSLGSEASFEEEEPYAAKLARLQKEADDFSKGGDNANALRVWEEALKLAEEEGDTVEVRTEMMCTIVNMHLQLLSRVSSRNLPEDEIARKTKYHKQSARRLIEQIKVGDVKPYWLISTRDLLEVCMSAQSWEIALKVSDELLRDRTTSVPAGHLASIHASIASMKLASNRQAEAVHHLQQTSKYLHDDPKRNTEMYCNVLQLLANEYSAQGQLDLAQDALKQQLKNTDKENVKAKIYCQLATDVYIPRRQLDEALESLQNATVLQSLCEDPTMPVHMLQTKADVLTRLGKFDQALVMYEKALAQYDNIAHVSRHFLFFKHSSYLHTL